MTGQALKGQIALVTGGGSGIGRSTAIMLAAEGARVVVMGRRLEPLNEVVVEINAAGGEAYARKADLQKREDLLAMMKWIEETVGTVDLMINNAGLNSQLRNIRWMEPDDWDSAISVNLTAVYTLMQAALPGMLAAGRGTFVTVSSMAAVRPNLLGGAPYGAAKAAVRNLMGFMHATFRTNNIRSCTILPGETDTPIMDARQRPPTADERAAMVAPDDVARAILLACTLPQGTTIEELVITPTLPRDQAHDVELSRWLGAPKGTSGAPSTDPR